jgi:hypothetical protein
VIAGIAAAMLAASWLGPSGIDELAIRLASIVSPAFDVLEAREPRTEGH